MLDHYLEVATERRLREAQETAFIDKLASLPEAELARVRATGEIKLAYMESDWVEKFKGTPLLAKALTLAEQELRFDTEMMTSRRAREAQSDQMSMQSEMHRLERRLLELELVKLQGGASQESPESPEEVAPSSLPMKTAHQAALRKVAELDADAWGRALLHAEYEEAQKTANMGAVMNFAKKNPGMVIGGALGAAHGLMGEDGGLGTAALEGAGGAALGLGGHAAYNKYKRQQAVAPALLGAKVASLNKEAFGAALASGLSKAIPTALNWVKSNPLKAGLSAVNGVSNFRQARQNGQGLGGSLISGLGGAAEAVL